jgi:hypothetical protein
MSEKCTSSKKVLRIVFWKLSLVSLAARFEFLCFNFEFSFPGLFRISIFEFWICRQELTDNSHDRGEAL